MTTTTNKNQLVEIAAKISAAIHENRISISELSRQSKVSRCSIYKILNYETYNITSLVAVCDVLKLKLLK